MEKKIVVTYCDHPKCTGHLIQTGGQFQKFEYDKLKAKS